LFNIQWIITRRGTGERIILVEFDDASLSSKKAAKPPMDGSRLS